MLDDPGIGRLGIGVIDDGIALEVRHVQHFRLKAHGAELQIAQSEIEILIDGTGIDDPVRHGVPLFPVLQIIRIQSHFDTVQHALHHLRVAAHGDSLIQGVEIVVVKGQPHRQSLDDERRQLRAGSSPLFLGIALDQFLIDIRSHQADGLFFQILRFRDPGLFPLLSDALFRFLRRHHAPHLIEGIHVERKRVQLPVVIGHGRIGIAVELRELSHVIPHFLIVGVEDVRAVFVDVDAFHFFRIDIACHLRTTVDDHHALSGFLCLVGKHCTEQSGTDNEIIYMFHLISPMILFFYYNNGLTDPNIVPSFYFIPASAGFSPAGEDPW